MEQPVSRRKIVEIIIAPTYDDSRAKIGLWNDPLRAPLVAVGISHLSAYVDFSRGRSLSTSVTRRL